jgi:hypothetical protein
MRLSAFRSNSTKASLFQWQALKTAIAFNSKEPDEHRCTKKRAAADRINTEQGREGWRELPG